MERVIDAAVRFRDRMRYSWPQNWSTAFAAAALVVLGCLLASSNASASGVAIAAAWLVLGGVSLLTVTGRASFDGVGPLYAAAGAFLIVLLLGLYQLTPGGPGLSHPMWQLVDAPGAVTLNRDATGREWLKLTALGAAFCVGMVVGRNDRRARLFYSLLLWGALLLGLGGLADARATSGEGPASWDEERSLFFGIMAILALTRSGQLVREQLRQPGVQLQSLRAMVIPALTLGLCASLVAAYASPPTLALFIAAVCAAIAWECFAFRGRSPFIMAAMAAAAVASATALVAFVFVLAPTMAAQSTIEGGRWAALSAHASAITQSSVAFILGNGLGSFQDVNALLQSAQNWRALAPMETAQSLYVQWFLEAGLLSVIAMGAAIGTVCVMMAQAAFVRKRLRSWLRVSVVVSVFALLQGVHSDALQTYANATLWAIMLGVGAGLATSRAAGGPRRT